MTPQNNKGNDHFFNKRQDIIALIKEEMALRCNDNQTIHIDKGFMEFGLDSIELLDLGASIEEATGIEIEPDILFEYSTIESLATYLHSVLNPKVEQVGSDLENDQPENDVAVIGLGCSFPGGANNPELLWQALVRGDDLLEVHPTKRSVYKEPLGGFLDEIEYFDAEFFGISPKEAIYIDPQQRLLLENIWDALKHAEIDIKDLRGSKTGVYVGISNNDYRQYLSNRSVKPSLFYSTGVATSVASGRISYLLGLSGPCMSVDTACSSSLVSVHLACQAIRNGECNLAIVAGVNIILEPTHTNNLMAAGMLSVDGKCKSFDIKANGFVRSEGCGVVILSKSDANFAKEPLAIIKGSAVNQDGHSSGLSAPSIKAQQDVIDSALSNAGICAADVDYIEAHGSGTPIGDTIELNALKRCYMPRDNKLKIGSIKASIGHTESGSGIAGLIKVVLSLMYEKIPPQINFQQLNKNTKLSSEESIIHTELKSWPRSNRKRIAGVSSFGFSGTNCHMILSESSHKNIITPYVGNNYMREKIWVIDDIEKLNNVKFKSIKHDVLSSKTTLANGDVIYIGKLNLKALSYLKSHDIFGNYLFPGAAFLELLMKIAFFEFQNNNYNIDNFSIIQALIINQDETIELQVIVKKTSQILQATIYAKTANEVQWIEYAVAEIVSINQPIKLSQEKILSVENNSEPKLFYEAMNKNGIHYGNEFKVIKSINIMGNKIVANLQSSEAKSDFSIHPTLLDGCFQAAVLWDFCQGNMKNDEAYLPISINTFRVYKSLPEYIVVLAEIKNIKAKEIVVCDIKIMDQDGNVIANIDGLTGKRATHKAIKQQLAEGSVITKINKTIDLYKILKSTPKQRRLKVIKGFIKDQVAKVLNKDPKLIDMSIGFFDMGMDSLMLLEVQQRVQVAMGEDIKLNQTASFDFPSPDALSIKVFNDLENEYEDIIVSKIETPIIKNDKVQEDVLKLSIEDLIKKIDED